MGGRRWLSVALSVLMTVVLFGVVAEAQTTPGPELAAEVAPLVRQPAPGLSGGGLTLTISGGRQGDIKADTKDGSIPLLGYSHAVTSVNARQAGSGLATGRRQHAPLTVSKVVDRTSPQLMQALITNEHLRTVQLTFMGTPASGIGKNQGQPLYTITLNNAAITDVAQSGGAEGLPMETISFSYESITWTWLTTGTEATDNLLEGR